MKTRLIFIALVCTLSTMVSAQTNTVTRFLHDGELQDSIIAAIVPNHTLMSKLIDKIAENRRLHEMVIQHLTRLLNEESTGAGGHNHASHETMSHYIGDEKREIKALSPDEVKGLENGEGIGLAMAAELNHYPGPRHVLDLKDKLELSDKQVKSIQSTFDRMHANAVRIGRELIESERSLDNAFSSANITRESLRTLTSAVENLRGRLRFEHLSAHIDTRSYLTSRQIEMYDQLRGYTGQR
ncbi:MAG TPA: hypothetical protein VI758_04470 [Bacteroidota bacterium]